MTRLESIRKCKVDEIAVQYVLPGKPHGATVGVCKRGFILQTGTNEPIGINDAAMKRLSEWLHDKIFAEAD